MTPIKGNCHIMYYIGSIAWRIKNKKFIVFRAVYCILGGCDVEDDHPEVAGRLEDYLWIKLSVIRFNSDGAYSADYMTFAQFQEMIIEKYGRV